MRINVTARDISRGQPNNRLLCPITFAARRRFKDAEAISTGPGDLWVYFHDRVRCFRLPPTAQIFVRTFDQGHRELKPFQFDVQESETCAA